MSFSFSSSFCFDCLFSSFILFSDFYFFLYSYLERFRSSIVHSTMALWFLFRMCSLTTWSHKLFITIVFFVWLQFVVIIHVVRVWLKSKMKFCQILSSTTMNLFHKLTLRHTLICYLMDLLVFNTSTTLSFSMSSSLSLSLSMFFFFFLSFLCFVLL